MKRYLLVYLLTLTAGLFSISATAGECGAGKITHIEEGKDNNDDFFIAIDYSVVAYAGQFLVQDRYIRFKQAELTPDRFRGIKALAYMAYSTGSSVWVKAIGAGCGGANNLRILGENQPVDPPIPTQ